MKPIHGCCALAISLALVAGFCVGQLTPELPVLQRAARALGIPLPERALAPLRKLEIPARFAEDPDFLAACLDLRIAALAEWRDELSAQLVQSEAELGVLRRWKSAPTDPSFRRVAHTRDSLAQRFAAVAEEHSALAALARELRRIERDPASSLLVRPSWIAEARVLAKMESESSRTGSLADPVAASLSECDQRGE